MAQYAVSSDGVAHVHALIDRHQYVLDSDWGEVLPDAAAQNAYLERHSWQEYAAWHLGLTEGAKSWLPTSCSSTSTGSRPDGVGLTGSA